MGVSPQPTWRGSYLESASNPQAKSACMKIINGAIVIFGVSYLLYVLVVALGPVVQPAHNAVKLRVHLRSGTGVAKTAPQKGAGTVEGSNGHLVMPGHNQAPSLQTGMQPELEALAGDGAGEVKINSAVAGSKAAGKEGKALQQPLKQKGTADQPGKLKDQSDTGSNSDRKVEGREEKEVKKEKEQMISQQQREQLEKQLKENFGSVSEAK